MHNFGKSRLVEPGVTNWPVTTIGMWGCMPVLITGVVVRICICFNFVSFVKIDLSG